MNLPDLLNVAIGVVVLYVLLSSIASLLLEFLTGVARYREEILYVTINRLLAGQPDEPWNLSQLVLDRIGERLAQNPRRGFGLAGVMGRWFRREHSVVAPGRTDGPAKADGSPRSDIVQRFWRHPKILSLATPGADAPPAMEAGTFANVVIDVAIPRDAQGGLPDNRLSLERALAAPNDDTPVALLKTLRTLGLSSEIPAGATGEMLWGPFRANIAAWFTEASARSTEIYRKTMRWLLLGIGLLLALVLNADSIRTIQLLSHDSGLREAVAAYSETLLAERTAAEGANAGAKLSAPGAAVPAAGEATRAAAAPTSGAVQRSLQQTREALGADIDRLREIERLGFPLGWGGPDHGYYGGEEWFETAYAHTGGAAWGEALAFAIIIVLKFAGLLMTALAVSLGAPFWYDLMSRLIALRKGSQPEASPAPGSGTDGALASGGAGKPLAPTGPVAPATPLPLEIGHDLAAPATSFDRRKACWLARASAAAYSPKAEIEALVRTSWRFHEFHFYDQKGTQCFCASDEEIVLIAFRGTELSDLNDILADVNAKLAALTQADYTGAPARRVHVGFLQALDLVWGDLSAQVMKWTQPQPGRAARQIFITGHSLGGALATLLFVRLAIDPTRPVPVLYTFGCPKVGDEKFAAEMDRRFPERVFRLVNDTDVVPTLPPLPDYHHAGAQLVFGPRGDLVQEISGLGRLLGYAAAAARSVKDAGKKAVDDHGVAHYVERCEALVKVV